VFLGWSAVMINSLDHLPVGPARRPASAWRTRTRANPRPSSTVVRQTKDPAEGSRLVYQSSMNLSTKTLTRVAAAIGTHRRRIGSRWRKLPDGQAALIVLAYLRHDQRLADLAGANRVSASTVHRWVQDVIDELASQAPRLSRALNKLARAGAEVVLIDGTLVRTRRRSGKTNRPNYSGKHKTHGLLFIAITDAAGNLLWISAAKPGRTADVTAARHNRLPAALRAAGLAAICDLGFTRLDDDPTNPVVITGRRAARRHPLTPAQKQANQLVSRERAANEHGFADLKNWRILTRLRNNPTRATALLRALLVLTQTQISR
jgi:DDE superfamily endonuclease/Helix-turn-helix of DDE superfamily endonuclease